MAALCQLPLVLSVRRRWLCVRGQNRRHHHLLGAETSYGALGVPSGTPTFAAVSVGGSYDGYACGVRTDGTITCWGDNNVRVDTRRPPGR